MSKGVDSLGSRNSSSAIPSKFEYEGFLWKPEYLSNVYSSLVEGVIDSQVNEDLLVYCKGGRRWVR